MAMNNNDIRLIAFDLDGTFLDDIKNVPEENLEAIDAAAEMGICIVPATGRLYKAIPAELLSREYMRYFILMNGAKVYDSKEDRIVYSGGIPRELALRVLEYGDTLPCIYDIYYDDGGFMTQSMYDDMLDYMPDKHYAALMRALREGVPDLKQFIREGSGSVQKMQFYFKDLDERKRQITELGKIFPELKISTSLQSNIEINHISAGKGLAISALCSELGFGTEKAAAFGDGTNDTEMVTAVGWGVAMKNADALVKKVARVITEDDNNSAGVGRTIKQLLDL